MSAVARHGRGRREVGATGVILVGDDRPRSRVSPPQLHGKDALEACAARLRGALGPGERLSVHTDRLVIEAVAAGDARDRMLALQRAALAAGDGDQPIVLGSGFSLRRRRVAAVQEAGDHAMESLRAADQMIRPDVLRPGRRTSPGPLGTPLQVIAALTLSFGFPFLVLLALHRMGLDGVGLFVALVVVAMLGTAAMQWAEVVGAVRRPRETTVRPGPRPRATAIVVAYLPNEAETIVETLDAVLANPYSGGLQVILAYNTPRDLPVEVTLEAMAANDANLTLLRVEGSTSKAQNVNTALAHIEGEFVGIFDADHLPDPDAFERAAAHLADGADVVQGHCVVRNGEESFVARLVACEFEQIYALSHPGRAVVHGFGIFGGSNGYWRTSLLRTLRLRGAYLTEDIDSSLRAVSSGHVVVNDPEIISRELAPTTWKHLWKQRMRWAQGWVQVTRTHGIDAARSDWLTLRQKLGVFQLLVWREMFPWLSALMLPTLAFAWWRDGALTWWGWGLLVTAVTLGAFPVQVAVARSRAVPEIRERGRWWFAYAVVSLVFYQELKNLMMRVSQLKELAGERHWAVTPRAVPMGSAPRVPAAAQAEVVARRA
ncbi:glycosyltransferase [Serinibacter salmoneus]|uniref:Cellulose synthase/poly-beta-1,6-N-acetylglucosamine synthase-like glycosyltransferase n=1 Tax=Serinibacter salmoneus TaxID=556530 RepID=A0A2A9CYP1_9MICO|nr:glycosyltransferase family 2 protein [Serinibacter salmoneus]PFG18792.1 cellulose synthase/poly-beta-1,6-N-acetylglucosamine synthase-like glycosyltransferase [Serinibacter salmoneus]